MGTSYGVNITARVAYSTAIFNPDVVWGHVTSLSWALRGEYRRLLSDIIVIGRYVAAFSRGRPQAVSLLYLEASMSFVCAMYLEGRPLYIRRGTSAWLVEFSVWTQ